MAQAVVTNEQLHREQLRLRHALAVGRMCALEYWVDEDRLECSCERSASHFMPLHPLNGSLASLLDRIHPEDRARVESTLRDALESAAEIELEARLVSPVHGTRWLLLQGSIERDAAGRATHVIGVARDNTARREGEVVRHKQAHGERLRALGLMAAGVAHSLNQKLTLISGYSDMARQELTQQAPDLSRVREAVEITAGAAIAGGDALSGVLSFVRSREFTAEVERLKVDELLQQVALLTAPRWRDAAQIEGRPIELTVSCEPDLTIRVSAADLREAITNLIFNAIDALPQGGAINLRAFRRHASVIIEIDDTGAGIPRDVLSRIFDPFFTTKGEHGTGLGLPQVRGIVERHGGTIDVETEPGKGTTFRIALPASDEDVEVGTVPMGELVTSTPRQYIRILVVEDEQQLARMASIVLKQRGHDAVVANSAEEAIALLEHESAFDLVISDLGLGAGKNGWELAEFVRRTRPNTTFVLVTGWGAAINPDEARLRGVDRVVAKPYRISELRQLADDVAAELAKQ